MKLFIFGSTGDLVKGKVLNALQKLKLKDLEIYALGRKKLDNLEYKNFICSEECNKDFRKKLNYLQIDYNSKEFKEEVFNLLEKGAINFFYVALPPNMYSDIISFVGEVKKRGYNVKLLIEKPFGQGLFDSKKLINLVKKYNLVEEMFISDHYLFKDKIFYLNKADFKELKIISNENIGLRGREGYYEGSGELNDMIQGHLLNILFKIYPKKEELRNLVVKNYLMAQYGNGINKGYVKELGRKSNTETFVYVNFEINNKEIVLVSGKRLNKKLLEIQIDNKKIDIPIENSYITLFKNFFEDKKENFPTLQDIILSWEIIEKIRKFNSPLRYYQEDSKWEEVINEN